MKAKSLKAWKLSSQNIVILALLRLKSSYPLYLNSFRVMRLIATAKLIKLYAIPSVDLANSPASLIAEIENNKFCASITFSCRMLSGSSSLFIEETSVATMKARLWKVC